MFDRCSTMQHSVQGGNLIHLHVLWGMIPVEVGSQWQDLWLLRNDERWFVTKGPLVARSKRLRNCTAVMNWFFSNVYDLIANRFLGGRGSDIRVGDVLTSKDKPRGESTEERDRGRHSKRWNNPDAAINPVKENRVVDPRAYSRQWSEEGIQVVSMKKQARHRKNWLFSFRFYSTKQQKRLQLVSRGLQITHATVWLWTLKTQLRHATEAFPQPLRV